MPRWPGDQPPPIESLRPGALPADSVYRPPPTAEQQDELIRDHVAELRARRGRHEDGTPAVASFDGAGGHVFYPRSAMPRKLPRCAECGLEFITAEFLAAHRERDHPREPDAETR